MKFADQSFYAAVNMPQPKFRMLGNADGIRSTVISQYSRACSQTYLIAVNK